MPLEGDARVERLNDHRLEAGGRCVVYWMQNGQRERDIDALDAAIRLANAHGVGVVAYFALDATVPHASARTFTFLLDGLRETMAALRERGVGVLVRAGAARGP
jgi:deoxyribodipyrimidine photo-lyase